MYGAEPNVKLDKIMLVMETEPTIQDGPDHMQNFISSIREGKLINPNLKLISKGQLKVDGNNVSVQGEVANEAQRQRIAGDIAASLNPTYLVKNGLRVSAAGQDLLEPGAVHVGLAGADVVAELRAAMPTVRTTIAVPWRISGSVRLPRPS